MAEDMKADPPKKVVDFPSIDYSELKAFIQGEKLNGMLVGDPAWEEGARKKLKSWDQHLQASLENLNRNFRE